MVDAIQVGWGPNVLHLVVIIIIVCRDKKYKSITKLTGTKLDLHVVEALDHPTGPGVVLETAHWC